MTTCTPPTTGSIGSSASSPLRRISGVAAGCAAALLLAVAAQPCAAGTLVFGDNFNAPDNANFDNSDQTGRRSGLLAADVQLRSSRIQHGIASNQVNLLRPASGSGRIRFHSAANLADWFDFASSTATDEILADGGVQVDFDYTPVNNTATDWVSFNIGFLGLSAGEPTTRVNHAETDFGILFRNNGGTQHFVNGVATTGANFPATLTQRHVTIRYAFSSFDDGTEGQASAWVDGLSVLSNQPFTLGNNGGIFHMELGNFIANTRVDNLAISTVPEPSAAGLLGVAATSLALLRRRR